MATNLATIDDITLAALDVFENRLVAAKRCSRKLEKSFGQKGAQIGDSVRVRLPIQGTVRTGQAWAGQDISEQYTTMVLNYQKGMDFSMSSKERKLDLNSMTEQILKPYIVRLANEVDKDILEVATKACYQAVGTPGSTPSALSTFLGAGKLLTNQTCPRGKGERHLMLDADTEASMVDQLKGLFQNDSKLASQYDSGEMGYVAGMNWNVDQNVYTHTAGTYTAQGKVSGANQTGSSLITNTWTSGGTALKAGDRFTIANVFDVNPVTKSTLKNLKQFVVLQDIADTTGAITMSISPAIVGPGDPYQNVSALPADAAQLTMFSASGTVSPTNILWNEEAVSLAIVPLEKPDGVNNASMKYDDQSGVGLRYIEWYDGDTDLWKSRFDVVYGILPQRMEWACAIAA
jgi:hypothetical protein